MFQRSTAAALSRLVAIAFLAVGCRDAVSPQPHVMHGVGLAAATGAGIFLDQQNGAFGDAVPWGTGGTPTTADPGVIPVNAGALAFGVSMSDRIVGLGTPTGFANVNESEDQKMKGDAEYFVQGAVAGSAEPRWTWFFDQTPSPGNWLATVLTLNPAATHLAFTVQPSTTLPFMTITPAVQVTAEDDQGNPLTGFTGAVSIAIGHN